jgi:hypothetical protein
MINSSRRNRACWRQRAAAGADFVSPLTAQEYRVEFLLVLFLDVLVVPIESEIANGR